jgi:AraC-like DNA-binding protein
MLKKYSEEAVSKTTKNKMSMTQKVEQTISSQPGKTQEKVAKELGVSTRTLARRLKAEKTTYFKVVEAYREAMAKSMLSDTQTQITEIAFVLGYADTSTFSSAFKRWSGKSPSEYRT